MQTLSLAGAEEEKLDPGEGVTTVTVARREFHMRLFYFLSVM